MHELSIAQALCEALEGARREHGASRVVRAVVEAGPLSNVVPSLLEQAFASLQEVESILVGTRLEIRSVALLVRCEECEKESETQRAVLLCPTCGSGRMAVVRGDELTLREVELEIEGEAS